MSVEIWKLFFNIFIDSTEAITSNDTDKIILNLVQVSLSVNIF